jgi:hypothetical protein
VGFATPRQRVPVLSDGASQAPSRGGTGRGGSRCVAWKEGKEGGREALPLGTICHVVDDGGSEIWRIP